MKKYAKPEYKELNTKIDQLATDIATGSIEIVHYSEKAIALFGDTKPIKEDLKRIGARFNPFLTRNGNKEAGWILPSTKMYEVTKLFNSYYL